MSSASIASAESQMARRAGIVSLLGATCSAICSGAEVGAMLILLGACVIMALEVFFRYVLNASLMWSEELARYLLIALTFVGAFVSYHRNDQLAMTFLLDRLTPRLRELASSARDGIIASFAAILLVYGVQLCVSVAGTFSPVLDISDAVPYAVVPVFGAAVLLQALTHVAQRRDMAQGFIAALAAILVGVFSFLVHPPAVAAMLLTLATTIALGVPIAFGLGLGGMIGVASSAGPLALVEVPQRLAAGVNSFLLLAIPFFMLSGTIMSRGGFSQKLVDFIQLFVGRLRGGLAVVDVLVSMVFADISGTAAGDTAAIGSVLIPQMVKRGYKPAYAAALQSAAGTLGLMFPPATALLIYAYVAQTSVAKLFAAALVPGGLVALTFVGIVLFVAIRHNHPVESPPPWPQVAAIGWRSMPPLFTIVVILGGILGGIFTPTEAGVAAALYALIASLIMRDLHPRQIKAVLTEASVAAARVTLIIAGATLMGWTLTSLQIPVMVTAHLAAVSKNPFVILMLINVMLILAHGLMEAIAAILLIVPIVLPLVGQMGVDPVSFGVILVINSAIGLVLPPVGINTYLTSAIVKGRVEDVTRAVLPFALGLAADMVIVTAYPQLCLWLPHLLHMS
jgi:tripartite ATP-independent transporter DctM subunit